MIYAGIATLTFVAQAGRRVMAHRELDYAVAVEAKKAGVELPKLAKDPFGNEMTGYTRQLPAPTRFSLIAKHYDKAIHNEEDDAFITEVRRDALKYAYGDVLEVASGTARSLHMYDPANIRSLTFLDYVPQMLEVGLAKVKAHITPEYRDDVKVRSTMEALEFVKSVAPSTIVEAAAPTPALPEQAFPSLSSSPSSSFSSSSSFSALSSDGSVHRRIVPPSLPPPKSSLLGSYMSYMVGRIRFMIFPPTPPADDPHAPRFVEDGYKFFVYKPSYPVSLVQGDAQMLEGIPDNTFDTVVDCFGLCSVDKPVEMVKEMQRVVKPTGRIILVGTLL